MKHRAANWLALVPERRGFTILIFAVAAGLLAAANLPWHLDDFDQAKQAFVSHEMTERGKWLVQRTPHHDTATKPPFAGWVSAALRMAGLPWDLAWRLPGLLAAGTLGWLLFREGRLLLPAAGGALAVSAFVFNLLTPRITTLVRTDMLLALSIFICGWLIYRKVRDGAPWTAGERWGFCGAMTASLLIKGPVIYAFLPPAMIVFALWALPRERRGLVWSGWWTWVLPLVALGAWAGAALLTHPEFYQHVVEREFLTRFQSGEPTTGERAQPFWFYGPHLLHKFFPWSALLLCLPLLSTNVRVRFRAEPGVFWLVCWTVASLVVMSLIPSKRVDRIYPLLAPASLLVAALAPYVWNQLRWRAVFGAAVLFAMLGYGAFFTGSGIHGYVTGADSLTRFAAQAREMAARQGHETVWLMTSRDEGLLLYFDQPGFLSSHETIMAWRGEEDWDGAPVGALVYPERRREWLEEILGPQSSALESGAVNKNESAYYLILRWNP